MDAERLCHHALCTMHPARFLILGHRGSPRSRSENTLESIREALASGADGFETDLRRLADGSVVLFHDDSVGDRSVEQLTLGQLRSRDARIALLRSLDAIDGPAIKVLEVKRHGWEQELLALIEGWQNVVVSSFDHRVLTTLRDLGCEAELGMILSGYQLGFASYARTHGASWAFPNVAFVDRDLVDSLRAEGIRVVPWTVNRPEEWARAREIGCHGVITDIPAEAVAWRDAR